MSGISDVTKPERQPQLWPSPYPARGEGEVLVKQPADHAQHVD